MVGGQFWRLSVSRAISCRLNGAATPYLCHAHATDKHLRLALFSGIESLP